MSEEIKITKHYISSPTEDGEINDDEQTFSWPEFPEIKGVLDFKSTSGIMNGEKLIALMVYIIRGNVSSINVTNVSYLLKLFYENECKAFSAYRDNRSLIEEKVKSLLDNRKFIYIELLTELNIK